MDPIYLTTAIPFVNAPPHLGHALELVQADAIARARARSRPGGALPHRHRRARTEGRAGGRGGGRGRRRVRRAATRSCSPRSRAPSRSRTTTSSAPARSAPPAGGRSGLARVRGGGRPVPRAVRGLVLQRVRAVRRGRVHRARRATRVGRGGELVLPALAVRRAHPCVDHLRRAAHRSRGASQRGAGVPRLRRARHQRVEVARARARDWGIPVPGDPDQIIYVWFDALINYLSAAPAGWWSESVTIRHVIGKGIVRFHAVIWPAILLSAGLPLPDELFVHDYVTANGRKIGKSLGNAVDPLDLVAALRRRRAALVAVARDPACRRGRLHGNRLVETANRDLANGVGNLVQRIVGLGGAGDEARRRPRGPRHFQRAVDEAIARLRPASGDRCDRCRGGRGQPRDRASKPWTLAGDDRAGAVAPLAVATRAIVDELAPFVPDLAAHAARRLEGTGAAAPVFARLS